ncbi:WSC-domain-containing protein [Aspergillus campestris IBT 28561]|uniref:WSC-domain-containing protein n=1 Tax=Aspergillus campestris (strain IBT 28561) TaxID=1392248 RepID=A0A2I1CT00_ASPC2|nr:WSC-domain-containing protein [Aspergillus campestris IBT 28561]PKY00748.1 WSC-domain-containing protein [Aspergillus campestris IBT 28561]
MFSKTLSLASVLALTISASAFTTTCYSDSGDLKSLGLSKYESTELCGVACRDRGAPVAAVSGGNECWCGDEVPSEDSKVDKEKCNTKCDGWPESTCGGDGFWEVWLSKAKVSDTKSVRSGVRAETFVA